MSQGSPVVVVQNETNGLALAGLIFSILGWLTCGLLSLIGAPLSFLGLFSKGPKGMAVAGLLVGFPGVLFFVFIGMGMLAGVLGLGAAATAIEATAEANAQAEQTTTIDIEGTNPSEAVDARFSELMNAYTSDLAKYKAAIANLDSLKTEQQKLQASLAEIDAKEPEKPVLEPRQWTAEQGDYRIEATYISADANKVTLSNDDGKTVSVDIAKLVVTDRFYIKNTRQEMAEHDAAHEAWSAERSEITSSLAPLTAKLAEVENMAEPVKPTREDAANFAPGTAEPAFAQP